VRGRQSNMTYNQLLLKNNLNLIMSCYTQIQELTSKQKNYNGVTRIFSVAVNSV